MAELTDKIVIHFEPKGDKGLVTAIKSLDRATKSMMNTQASMADFQKSGFTATEKGKAAYIRLKNTMKSYDKTLLDVTKDTKLLAAAQRGDTVALMKLSRATRKYTRDLDKNKAGILGTTHDTRILGGSFAVLRSKMLLASFATAIVGGTIGKLTKAYGEQEAAEKKLETALGRRSNALLAYASQQQKVTTFGDEETITAMALVGAYTDNEKAISRLTKASMDLAVAKGMDLNSAVDLVSKSVFSSTNALSRYGVSIEGTAGSVGRLESATTALTALYGGQAEASALTFLGSIDQMGNSIGDVGEKFGSFFIPAITLSAQAIKAFADSIDAEEIKAYVTAIIGVSAAWIAYTKGTLIASKATALFNKISKKNIAIFVGMLAVGALIDKFNIFAGSTGDLTEELKELEGSLKGMDVKSAESAASLEALVLITKRYANVLSDEDALNIKRLDNIDKMKQMREKLGMTLTLTSTQEAEIFKGKSQLQIEWITLLIESDQIATELAERDTKRRIESLQQLSNGFASTVSSIDGLMSARDASSKREEIAAASSIQNEEQRKNKLDAISEKYDMKAQSRSKKMKLWKMASAVSNTALAVTQVLADETIKPSWLKFPIAGMMIAQGVAQAATINAQAFAKGGDFVTNKPEMIMVGEAGREHVRITPIDRPESRALKDGGNITLNISAPLIDETILDTIIPAIQKAQRMNLA
jgi:hypothetical protein